jgi:hypothetical protein
LALPPPLLLASIRARSKSRLLPLFQDFEVVTSLLPGSPALTPIPRPVLSSTTILQSAWLLSRSSTWNM